MYALLPAGRHSLQGHGSAPGQVDNSDADDVAESSTACDKTKKRKRSSTGSKAKGAGADATGVDGKPKRKTLAPVGAWVGKLSQPADPPQTQGGAARNQLVNDDILFIFHELLQGFLKWKPVDPESTAAQEAKPVDMNGGKREAPNGTHILIGKNNFQYLELCTGISEKHKFGFGEFVRFPFRTFCTKVFRWVQDGGKASNALSGMPKKDPRVKWDKIMEAVWDVNEARPAWNEVRDKRKLAKGCNETLRLRFKTVLENLLVELRKQRAEEGAIKSQVKVKTDIKFEGKVKGEGEGEVKVKGESKVKGEGTVKGKGKGKGKVEIKDAGAD